MKRLISLILLCLIVASCSSPLPASEEVLSKYRGEFQGEAPASPTENPVEETKYVVLEPTDWDGPVVTWAIPVQLIDIEDFPLESLNKHLERQNEPYRLSVIRFLDDLSSERLGRNYLDQLLPLLDEGRVDIINAGYRYASVEDELSVPILIEQDKLLQLEVDDFTYGTELSYQGSLYGMGNPNHKGHVGLFVPDSVDIDLTGLSLEDSINALQQANLTAAFGTAGEFLIDQPIISRLFTWDDDLVYFWQSQSFLELASFIEQQWTNQILTLDRSEADVFLSPGFPEDRTSQATALPGTFFALKPLRQFSNWYANTENMISNQSNVPEHALSFLKRLDEDGELMRIISSINHSDRLKPAMINTIPNRLFNELVLFDRLAQDMPNRSELEKGYYFPREITSQLDNIMASFSQDDHATMATISKMLPGWQDAAAALEQKLASIDGLAELREQLKQSILEQQGGRE